MEILETSSGFSEIVLILLGLLLVGVGYLLIAFRTMRSDIECMHETMHEFFDDTLNDFESLSNVSNIGEFLNSMGFDPSEIKDIEDSINSGNSISNNSSDNSDSAAIEDWDSGNSTI